VTASIVIDDVTLSVPIFLQRERRARGWASMFFGAAFDPPRRESIRLLDSISFTAREGDRVAILGRNGAGKSTLLRVINGVYAPSAGRVTVTGSCQALLNMSLGFNPDATVRENIFLRGTAMGLRAAELRAQIEPILDFSGLHDKSNHRLRTLSAGQKMRLGFAISTTFQHDVILMDEWVGAGDHEFMARATERMRDRVGGSKIVMLASHSVGLLRGVCNRGIVLEQGKLVYAGEIVPALRAYHELLAALRAQEEAVAPSAVGGEAATSGYVEQLVVEQGAAHVVGWCVTQGGLPPESLALAVHGVRYAPVNFERYARPDVVRHLGLNVVDCGFRARFDIPDIASIADLGGDVQAFGGTDAEQATLPLKLAPSIVAMLESARHAAAAAPTT
jgi:ABC-type polysaccharide/polyol phosphate transport system ATPase subunit